MAGAEVDPLLLLPNYGTMLVHDLVETLKEHLGDDADINGALIAFFTSEAFAKTPHVRIGAMLNAAMARRAARGMRAAA